MLNFFSGFVMFVMCASAVQAMTADELYQKGKAAYDSQNCIGTIKYLYAFLQVGENIDVEQKARTEKVVAYCEKQLSPFDTAVVRQPDKTTIITSDGVLRVIDEDTGLILTSEGVLAVDNSPTLNWIGSILQGQSTVSRPADLILMQNNSRLKMLESKIENLINQMQQNN